MELLTWVKDLLVGLAWPGVLVFFAIFFSKELRERISDLSEAGPTGLKFNPQRVAELPPPLAPTELPATAPYVHTLEAELKAQIEKLPTQDQVPTLLRELAASRTVARCELVHANIFGSQILGLDRLIQSGGSVPLEDAQAFYSGEVQPTHPDFYTGIDFDTWSAFLIDSELVKVEAGRVYITDFGRAYVQFAATRRVRPY